MGRIRAEAEAVVDARPEAVYAVLADYRVAHPQILPRQYFSAPEVEAGGTGAGTVFRVTVKVMGVERSYHMQVREPEPGRVLTETDKFTGLVTTFTVTPEGAGQARVGIATEWEGSRGFVGLLERLTSPTLLRRIYREELALLAAYVASKRLD